MNNQQSTKVFVFDYKRGIIAYRSDKFNSLTDNSVKLLDYQNNSNESNTATDFIKWIIGIVPKFINFILPKT